MALEKFLWIHHRQITSSLLVCQNTSTTLALYLKCDLHFLMFPVLIAIDVPISIVGSQPNIHPGSISSTGRQRIGTATSTQAAQLIGGGITPTLFTAQVRF